MATTIGAPARTITLRIRTALVPPKVRDGVETAFGIQDKARNLTPPVLDAEGTATFEVSVAPHCDAATDLDWSGPFVHGKPGERFLYLGWRPTAGPADKWIRRWKISLTNLPLDLEGDEILTTVIDANESNKVWLTANWQPITDY